MGSDSIRQLLHLPSVFALAQVCSWVQPAPADPAWCGQRRRRELWTPPWVCLQQVASLGRPPDRRYSMLFRLWRALARREPDSPVSALLVGEF